MKGEKQGLLNHVVYFYGTAEKGIEQAEAVHQTYSDDEEQNLGVAGQCGCCEGKQAVEESLLAVVFSPGLYPFGQSEVYGLGYQIFIVIVYFVASYDFVLIIEDEKKRGDDDGYSNEEYIQARVNFLSGITVS